MALNVYIPTLRMLAGHYIQEIDKLEKKMIDLKYSEEDEEKLKV